METKTARGALGRAGEEAAVAHYVQRGYRLIARNWTCRIGELDLVFARGSLLVFCEVKSRSGHGFGGPHDAVTWRKQHKLRSLAEVFLAVSRVHAEDVRFDVASVTLGADRKPNVFLFESAF